MSTIVVETNWESEKRLLYFQFSRYRQAAGEFCAVCYTQEEVVVLTATSPEAISTPFARRLLCEAANHWDSPDVYRRFLPRILAAMAPPELVEHLYPRHVFEALAHQQFAWWPKEEQHQVLHFLGLLSSVVGDRSLEALKEWQSALEALRTEPLALPASRMVDQ